MGLTAVSAARFAWQKKDVRAIEEIVQSMGQLKGALMKLGQMLSVTEDLVLPKELSALFQSLQKDAPPMSEIDLNSVFIDSFAKRPEEIFSRFERAPIAQASIGQVHLAYLPSNHPDSGRKVAVKVQYPKIKEAIIHDFKNIDLLDQLLEKIFKQKPNIETSIEEIKRTLVQECDYLQEANQLKWAREHYQKEFSRIIVPKVYSEFSNEKVLVMDYLEGDDFAATLNYPKEYRDELGQLLFDHFFYCLYQLKRINSDPQNGNYLFRPGQIMMLDFGATKEFGAGFLGLHRELISSLEDQQVNRYADVMIELGFFRADDWSKDQGRLIRDHFKMISELFLPYCQEGKFPVNRVNPFDSAKNFISQVDLKGRSAPRSEFVHLDRAVLGLYSKLRAWESSIDWVSSRRKYSR